MPTRKGVSIADRHLILSILLFAMLLPKEGRAKPPTIIGEWDFAGGQQGGQQLAMKKGARISDEYRAGGKLMRVTTVKGQRPKVVMGTWHLDSGVLTTDIGNVLSIMTVKIRGKTMLLSMPDKQVHLLYRRPGSPRTMLNPAEFRAGKRALDIYRRRSKAVEVTVRMRSLQGALKVLYEYKRPLPPVQTSWVPKTPCCKQPKKVCASDENTWRQDPWSSLQFGMTQSRYFQWRYRQSGKGPKQKAVIEARGDLDCDGRYSNYRLVVSGGPGSTPRFSKVSEKDPLE